jgi:hypothetical protein
LIAFVLLAAAAAGGGSALGAVQEPNGVIVPAAAPANETTLQAYFTAQMETIDAVSAAAINPGAFLPLCDFEATLVLSQSNAAAGIAWYNVPAAPTGPPATVYVIGPAALTVGQTITSADIRTSPDYLGGLIGFALRKNGTSVYYSEYQRNALCSGCTMPGYWKMALAYQSTRLPNSYYLAFEDWEGANDTTWFGNDGDFNDKVFRIGGVTCDGGGQPCDTQKLGVCAAGVTQCQVGGAIVCKQWVQPSAEVCDNLDNDCDGMVDGDGLCPGSSVCVNGVCAGPCGLAEFDCRPPYMCNQGLCIDPACVGITCAAGQVCRNGVCLGGCQGVKCPLGYDCQLGVCVDLCAGVSCPGAVCEKGACIMSCECRACPQGKACQSDGRCVDEGCQTMTCGAGQVCRVGSCVDACADAACPGGAACRVGKCDPPMNQPTGPSGTGGSGSNPTGGTGGRGRGGAGGTAGSGAAGGAPDAGATADGGLGQRRPPIACGCAAGAHPEVGLLLLVMLALLPRAIRPRRPR